LEREICNLRGQYEQRRLEKEDLTLVRDKALAAANEAQQRFNEICHLQEAQERQRQEQGQEMSVLRAQVQQLRDEGARCEAEQAALRATLVTKREQLAEREHQLRGLRRDYDTLMTELKRQERRAQEELRRLSAEDEQLRQKVWALEAALTGRELASRTHAESPRSGENPEAQAQLVEELSELAALLAEAHRTLAREGRDQPGHPSPAAPREAIERAQDRLRHLEQRARRTSAGRTSLLMRMPQVSSSHS
jgi:hypothetical protein